MSGERHACSPTRSSSSRASTGSPSWPKFAAHVENVDPPGFAGLELRDRRGRHRCRQCRGAPEAAARPSRARARALDTRPPVDAAALRLGQRRRRLPSEDPAQHRRDDAPPAAGRRRRQRHVGRVRRRLDGVGAHRKRAFTRSRPACRSLCSKTLLEHGAKVEPVDAADNGSAITSCLANGQPDAARFLASRGAVLNLEGAAGLGRLDVVQDVFRRQRRAPA